MTESKIIHILLFSKNGMSFLEAYPNPKNQANEATIEPSKKQYYSCLPNVPPMPPIITNVSK